MTQLDSSSRQSHQLGNRGGGSHRRPTPSKRGRRPLFVVAPVALVALVGALVAANQVASASRGRQAPAAAAAAQGEVSLWSADAKPRSGADPDRAAVEVGTTFRATVDGSVTGIRFYKHSENQGPHKGNLWDANGKLLASVSFGTGTASGWQIARLGSPVALAANRWYVVSYHAPKGRYADDTDVFRSGTMKTGVLEARSGVYAYGSTSSFPTRTWRSSSYYADILFAPGSSARPPIGPITPTAAPTTTKPAPTTMPPAPTKPAPTTTKPTSAPPPAPVPPPTNGKFPDASNTGVPDGTSLSRYTGSCTLKAGTVLDKVDATACDALLVRGAGVVIRNSLTPRIDATAGGSASVTVSDTTVRAGNWVDGAVWGYNITATRLDITGAQHSFHCGDNCTVTASWMHDQYNPAGGSFHNNAFITNGGSNMVVRGNTLHCTAILNSTDGGCTADVSLFGDFEPVRNVVVDGNLLKANNSSISYCAYGGYQPSKKYPVATGVVYTNNVFERGPNKKCGVYGPVTSFQRSAAGNVWSGNKWDDGTPLDA